MGRYVVQPPYSRHNRHRHTCMSCGRTYRCADIFCEGELLGLRCSDCIKPAGTPLRQFLYQPYVYERGEDDDCEYVTE